MEKSRAGNIQRITLKYNGILAGGAMKITSTSKGVRLKFAQEMQDRMEHPEKYPPQGNTSGPPMSYFEGAEQDNLTKAHEIAPANNKPGD